jgi:S1-C subfamily serine protease
VTAYHVVDGARNIQVRTSDGLEYDAGIVSTSERNDIAVLSIDAATPVYLPIRRAGREDVGEQVFTWGFPLENWLGPEVRYTEGTISAVSGLKGDGAELQVSVPVHPGNSGGPIVDEQGFAVGVVSHRVNSAEFMSDTGVTPENLSFAIRAEYALPLLSERASMPAARDVRSARTRARGAVCRVRAW